MYSRRLPSPPPRALSHHWKDDCALFLAVAKKLDSGSNSSNKLLFCPLCAQTFGYDFALECHLLSVHSSELDVMLSQKQDDIKVTKCTFCSVQFLSPVAALRHLHYQHADLARDMLLGRSLYDEVEDEGKYVSCRFCPQRFLSHHHKLMLLHMEHKHVEALAKMMTDEKQTTKHSEEVAMALKMNKSDVKKRRELTSKISSPAILVGTPTRQDLASPGLPLVDQSHFYYEIQDSPMAKPPKKKSKNKRSRRHSEGLVRKKDDFSRKSTRSNIVPPSTMTLKRVRSAESLNLSSKSPQPPPYTHGFALSSPSANQTKLFQCNLCAAAFLENAFLLSHLKNRHRPGMTMMALRPHYSCGACPAKFFKNSFLVKHVESRHQFQLVE